jgi:tetratricopeptide (TPR) repeat protein
MIEENQVPVLTDMGKIQSLNLSPEDFFILSRVNGVITVKEISQMVGFPIEKTIATLQKLLDNNVLSFKEKEEKKIVAKKTSLMDVLEEEEKDPVLSKILRATRNRVMLMLDGLDKKNHFEVLDVSPRAGSEEVHASYLKLVKEFHPDRLYGKELGHYKQKFEKIFDRVQEAYQEIYDEQKRAAYIHALKKPKGSAEAAKPKYEYKKPKPKVELRFADADGQFEMGKTEEKRGNLQAAMNFYQMAMNLNPKRKEYEDAYNRVRKLMREGF